MTGAAMRADKRCPWGPPPRARWASGCAGLLASAGPLCAPCARRGSDPDPPWESPGLQSPHVCPGLGIVRVDRTQAGAWQRLPA